LIGVVAGTGLAVALVLPVARVAVPDGIWQTIAIPDVGALGLMMQPGIILSALALAFVASTESLLSASAVDRMQDRVRTQYNRELFAQGIGNGVAGLLGGLPITGVIVRSSANVQAGAVSRLSAILHGVLILGFVSLMPGVLRLVPTAALAGVLVVIGWRLISLTHVTELWRAYGRIPATIWFATLLGVVATDLLTGVLIGLGLSIIESIGHVRRTGFRMRWVDRAAETELRLAGTATFLRLPGVLSALEGAPADKNLRIRTRGLWHMDHTFASALHQAAASLRIDKRRIVIV
jgi:MFS superfamily sulfate permease-like transporter